MICSCCTLLFWHQRITDALAVVVVKGERQTELWRPLLFTQQFEASANGRAVQPEDNRRLAITVSAEWCESRLARN